ncbi:MAG: cell division ATP-binding protein FtsE [Nitrospirota bacterium]
MILLFHVTKYYLNKQPVLSDINLNIKKGEFVFIVGPVGAGKTTLLKLLSFLEMPNEGQIIIDGRNIAKFKKSDILYFRRKIGLISQDFRLLPNRTLSENIAVSMKISGCDKRDIIKRGKSILRYVGLEGKKDVLPCHLSGGEQQKACIARALVNNPVILLADEPTVNLDPESSDEIISLFKDINLKGTTIVVATHNRKISNKNRVISLNKGRISES